MAALETSQGLPASPGQTAQGSADGTEPAPPPADLTADLTPDLTDVQINAVAVDRLSQAFESSAKRWELIVYPSLFAFIILAAYGFYLVFSLAKDVHYLAISVDSNMTVLASNMQSISDNMGQISTNVRSMSVGMDAIARDVGTLQPMLTSIENLDRSVQHMTQSTSNIRDDMSVMNHSISRPMQFMNRFMPW
jgi:methyl-accepting chemotaxis protein